MPVCIGAVMLHAQLHRAVMPELVAGPEVLPMQVRKCSSHPRSGPHIGRGELALRRGALTHAARTGSVGVAEKTVQ